MWIRPATTRYEPNGEDRESRPERGPRAAGTGEARGGAHETDTYGYAETEFVDRLKTIALPDPDDVADGLGRYVETKARADELDAKIAETDRLIDEIVYHLYDPTHEATRRPRSSKRRSRSSDADGTDRSEVGLFDRELP